ncbi:MAG: carbohydrate-binding domain-containing protein [Clostridium sp.]|nr:carbohydrate-binding domain-containing protein [Clostridium sp.]
MKRPCIFLTAILALCPQAWTQTLNLEKGGVTYSFEASKTGVMHFGEGGTSISIGDAFTFSIDESSRIWVGDNAVEDNAVAISYAGSTASVSIPGNIAPYVTASVDGAHVAITQSQAVGDNTCGEITYQLSGSSSDGSFSLTGSYKASLELLDLSLASSRGAALDIQNGKRISISSKNGTSNTLSDCASGSQKGCIVCKGHLEFKGKGSLSVEGNASHAIYAKEYVEVKNCALTITKAEKDGINCTQYFAMESGKVNISGTGDDGIQIDYKDAENRETEDTGSFSMAGGTLTISTTAAAAKGVKAEGRATISGGTLELSTSGTGKWDSAKLKTKAAACISSDEDIIITGGKLSLTATGGGGKGMSCDGNLTIDNGEIRIKTSGGVFAYVNNKTYDNYTGNTDKLNSDYKSSPKGIKADGNITVNDGIINVTCTGNGGEGLESKAIMTINGGTINVASTDDCLNSSSHMYITGGDITAVASKNDGLDSNGNMYISGGTVRAFGSSSPECGIDVNEEENYKLYFTGGIILGVGGSNSKPTNSSSTQPYVTCSMSVSKGQTISVKSGSTVLASFEVPDTYAGSSSQGGGPGGFGPGGFSGSGSSLIISCPGLVSGTSYTITNGTSTSTARAAQYGSSGGRP